MAELSEFHPAIQQAVIRHQEFFAGKRDYLIKVIVPIDCKEELEPEIHFNDVDWQNGFDDYVRLKVENGKKTARRRLAMGIEDDTIPYYYPYFGSSIHHSFYGGQVSFSKGTSYVEPVITSSAQWKELRPDMNSPWLQKLAKGLAYCRDHGEGVLLASYRGANGPLDMVNAVMGNNMFTEFYDDPDNLHRTLEECTAVIMPLFDLQRENNTEIAGGRIVPMGNMWVPNDVVGHIALDAACLAGAAFYEEFERPYLEKVTGACGGAYIHSHAWPTRIHRHGQNEG
ncbi:MAG: hypothetical protein Q7N50_01760, partial [Armatimonadota bacterium]|nr:hypothetical protein [Armatimonadota bacterium]